MRSLILRLMLFAATLSWCVDARSASMSDLWWNPNESGWGANIIEQQGTLFITLFVYGPDGRPTWYVGPDTRLTSSSTTARTYSGLLYATQGPWFASAFDPNNVQVRQVGAIAFNVSSQVFGSLTYSVDGVSVTKAVQRTTWKHINLSGTYYGAMDALGQPTCNIAGNTGQPFYAIQSIAATVNPDGASGGITMSIVDASGTSTFAGTYIQYGSLFDVTGTFAFPDGVTASARIFDFAADDDGIRGNMIVAGPCTLNMRFAALRPG